jgi:hypothetical protein
VHGFPERLPTICRLRQRRRRSGRVAPRPISCEFSISRLYTGWLSLNLKERLF